MLNVVVLMGRLTADPELKTTKNDVKVTSFSVAVDRSFSRDGGERQTDFINCVAWRNSAEFISKYFHKGQMIAINGSLEVRPYTDKEGNKRTSYDVVVSNASFCGDGKATTKPVSSNETPATTTTTAEDEWSSDMNDEDLPF